MPIFELFPMKKTLFRSPATRPARSVLTRRFAAILAAATIIAAVLPASTATAATGPDPLSDALVTCLLEPGELVAAGSPVPGVIARVFRERGDRVRKGEPLFELESTVERATLQLANARLDFARGKWERNQLLVREKVLSEQEIDELRHEVRLAEAAVAEASAIVERRRILSTVDGVVLERLASAGEYVRENPVLRVASLDPLRAELTLRAAQHGRLRVGQRLRLQVEGGHPPLPGRILNVDPHIDAASGTFTARVQLANPGAKVPPGLICRIAP